MKCLALPSILLLSIGTLTACGGGDSPDSDTTPPVITLNGAATIDHNYGDTYTDLGAKAEDNVDGVIIATTDDTINIDMINSYSITYTATDAAGNVSTIERTVYVVDVAPPVITLTGGDSITFGLGRPYKELGATAFDNRDGDIVVGAPTGTVDYETLGEYELTYSVTDTSNNESTRIRTIKVVTPRPFITTWKTDNVGSSADNEVRISTNSYFTSYDYNVDWGDGNTSENVTGDYTHTYDIAGTYTVTITGNFPQLDSTYSRDSKKLLSVEQWGDGALLSLRSAFNGCENLVINATDTPNLRLVTDMSNMFYGAVAFNQDISVWDVSTVTNMRAMFHRADLFNGDISAWDVSAVTNMEAMFSGADSFNGDISAWDVSAVTTMSRMFSAAVSFNQDISAWDVSTVSDMSYMFGGTDSFNGDIRAWDVSAVTNMEAMFILADSFNQDISTWDVSAVTDMSYMFFSASSFNQSLSTWDVSAVMDMSWMFSGARSVFDQDISSWNVSAVSDMDKMFYLSRTMSTYHLDNLLQSWSQQTVQNDVKLGVGDNGYSASSQEARDILTGTYGWTIE